MYRVYREYKPTNNLVVESVENPQQAWSIFFQRLITARLAAMVNEYGNIKGWIEYIRTGRHPVSTKAEETHHGSRRHLAH